MFTSNDKNRPDPEVEMREAELFLPVDLIEKMEAHAKATGRTWDELANEVMDLAFSNITETEARILAEAEAQGVSVQHLIERELWGKVQKREHRKPGMPEQRLRLWNEYLNSHGYLQALLLLSDDAISRESL